MNLNNNKLPNFDNLNGLDGTIYGGHNRVSSVNPYKCYFVANYNNGKVLKGNNLFQTGWDTIPQGLVKLSYKLSTGHIIEIPRYIAYKPMIECSFGMDGSRIFHFINVNCLAEKEIIIYKIVLRQDNISPYKIGDIIMSKNLLPLKIDKSWKYTDYKQIV